ncbi:MAG: nucleotidyltransferase domain-containing protein [Verrucomicrobiales bacterium]|nr:nucleotidyltransferase domain-containing protein [Verrucomicrobiales bacterium]
MYDRIQERLKEIEKQQGFHIIYAAESGSRAWGFASADSDYDVRFIYKWRETDYLSIYSPTDQLDLGVDRENLDFSGWDLRKSLALFRKSNGALMEWLHSPIVYFEDEPIMNRWRDLIPDFFVPGYTAAHYLGLSRKLWLDSKEKSRITAKRYLYILRALLSARYIIETNSPAPVEFSQTLALLKLPPHAVDSIESIIATKALQKEADRIQRNSILDELIESSLNELSPKVEALAREPGSSEVLDNFFRSSLL